MSAKTALFLLFSLLAIAQDKIYAQSDMDGGHVFFFMGERGYYELENLYSVAVWAYVPPGHRWKVGNSIINVEYNTEALRAVNSDSVWDAWPEFKRKAYMVRQADYGTSTSLTLIILHSNYAVIEGGEAVQLGRLVWEVRDGTQGDSLWMRSDSTHPQVSVILDSTFELKPMRRDFNTRWTFRSISPRVIDPSTAECNSVYYHAQSCELSEIDTTQTPLQDSCMYWHRTMTPTGAGPHVVSYQTDWSGAPIGTERVLHFLTQSLDSLFSVIKCKWQKQTAPGDLEWRELKNRNEGGLIRWSPIIDDFDAIWGSLFIGLTFHALHPNDLTKIVAAGDCGLGGTKFGMSTILLNNCPEFYRASPHFRWTTDYHTCGYSPRCLDLESILLHEAGHYLGLTHQEQPLSVIWNGYDGRNIWMHQCEANALRRLYSPQLLTQSPIPAPDNSLCMGTTDVEEEAHQSTGVVVDNDLQVFPMPITDGQLSIHAHFTIPTRVTLSILDLAGRTVQVLSDTYQFPGEQQYSFSVDLAAGTYFLKVETSAGSRIEKIVVLR